MFFRVKNKEGASFTMGPEKLYEQLMFAVADPKRKEEPEGGQAVVEVFANWVSATGFIIKHELLSSFFVAFKLGYYYGKFFSKQEVEIVYETDDTINKKEE